MFITFLYAAKVDVRVFYLLSHYLVVLVSPIVEKILKTIFGTCIIYCK